MYKTPLFSKLYLGDNLDSELKKILEIYYNALHEAVIFGVHLLDWESKHLEGDKYLTRFMFLRKTVEYLDTIASNIRFSIIDPCEITIRVLLETVLNFDYLLSDQSEDRSFVYVVVDFIRKIEKNNLHLDLLNELKLSSIKSDMDLEMINFLGNQNLNKSIEFHQDWLDKNNRLVFLLIYR